MPFEVGFPVFLAPAAIFLGAVVWLNAKVKAKGHSFEEGSTSPAAYAYLEFCLLGFAFLAGVLRTGEAVLQLVPCLYAIPAILGAIAVVSTARVIEPIEKDRQRVLLFLQGGLTLSALGFALALARPFAPSALYSGNTLGVAVLGLLLYASSLRATRKPAYLYCGFAALFLAYFGTFYFAKDLIRTVEEAARHAMGYDRRLPAPFRAINGLVFNVFLALLSRFFARKWSDDRLAWHCHAIGLPLSVAACIFSGFEPKAAVICLSGYAILYAVGTRMFHQPYLIYLACAAMAGSTFFAASLSRPAPLALQSMLASVLGLIFWVIRALPILKRAGEAYRIPLIHSARVMAASAMAAASLASIQDGMISPMATAAFLLTATLAMLNGYEAPRVSIYLLAIAALLGVWLGGYHSLIVGQPLSLAAHGLAIACFAASLIAAGEAVRSWLGDSEPGEAYLEAMGWAVPVGVFLAWTLSGWNLVDSVTVARSFLVGGSALLWLTRFRREPVLIYLGLGGLAAWAGCLCGLVAPWDRPGLAISWLAVTSGGVSIAFWGVGEWVRRRKADFYELPCFLMAGGLAGLASLLAFQGRWLFVPSYPVGLVAMLLGTVAFGLIAGSKRWPASVALAILSSLNSSLLVVMSLGMTPRDETWWLALAFAVQAIACRGVGWLVRRFATVSGSKMALPLDFGVLILTFLATPLGYDSPTILLLIAASSLLLIGCFPASEWLYATFLTVGAALYEGLLTGYSWNGLLPFVILGAYLSWGVAVALQRFGSRVLERLGLPSLKLEWPPVHSAMALGAVALLIRFKTIFDAGGVWTTLAWLPWSLALLCLLMLRFQPKRRGWVHAAAGFSGLGFTAMLAPAMDPQVWPISVAVARSLFWAIAARGAIRGEDSFRRRLGIARGFDAEVFREWALAMFGLIAAVIVGIVATSALFPVVIASGGWWDLMLAIGLSGLFVVLEGQRLDRDGRWIGLELVGWLAVWWLGSEESGLPRKLGLDRSSFLALATAAYGLMIVLVGFEEERVKTRKLADPMFDPGPDSRLGLRRFTSWFGFALGIATVDFVIFTQGRIALPSLLMTTASLGILALVWRRIEAAILGGLTWSLAVSTGFVLTIWSLQIPRFHDEAVVIASGLATALILLWFLAGRLRVRAVGHGGDPIGDVRVASAMEWVAVGLTVPAGLLTVFPVPTQSVVSSIVIFALAVFYAMVGWRKRAEWPVYVAQVLLLGSYFRFRETLAPSSVADAVILSLLAYLDLGLSELLGRLKLSAFIRPTFRFAMVLPLVPIIQGIWLGRLDQVDLFILLATGGFYAFTSFLLRSKTPAYAAGVLFNAFLWLAWYRMGWRFADRPQFYLIPVGFSSILFAEVNRKELSRSVLNGARNLGLVVIYASLASPIWETRSFGAWLTLLLLSLAGVFAGIGLRVQSFLWLGLVCFVADITYQLTRMGMDHVLARWGVMLSLGVALILFVALNEKKRIVATLKVYFDEARTWE
jgi:hypothetical protein